VKIRWPVVLFDLDGTIANSIDLIVASYDHAFRQVCGYGVSREQGCQWIGQTLPYTFGMVDPANAVELEAAYRVYNGANLDQITNYPGVPELLDDLRGAGCTTGVVTSKGRNSALASLATLGLDDSIEVLCSREDTDAHKPDPAPLLAALDKVGCYPADAAYVGDAVWDVLAAQAAGMSAVAVTWGAGLRDELAALSPEALVDSAAELRDLLMPELEFDYRVTKDRRVFITWRGRQAAILTGARAARFIAEVDDADDDYAQLLMARNTGNFKRGNERRR